MCSLMLSKKEEEILKGEKGEILQLAMKILISVGKIFNATKLVPIKSAHISGISIQNIGEPGLKFLEKISKEKVLIKTTCNPGALDEKNWREQNINEEYAIQQLKIYSFLRKMGVSPSFTCIPYLIGNKPISNEFYSWGESSAVIVANSFFNAYTNREPGPLTIASALIGKTPYYGLLIKENRLETIHVKLILKKRKKIDLTNLSAIGYAIGEYIGEGIPLIDGIKIYSLEEYKSFGSALATSSNVSLFKFKKSKSNKKSRLEKIEIDEKDIKNVFEKFHSSNEWDVGLIGCPHLSLKEIMEIYKLLKNKNNEIKGKVILYTSRKILEIVNKLGYKEEIEKKGIKFFADTCMVVSPIEKMNFDVLALDSCKAAHYLSSRGFKVILKNRREILGG
jgi:predicted aconitase